MCTSLMQFSPQTPLLHEQIINIITKPVKNVVETDSPLLCLRNCNLLPTITAENVDGVQTSSSFSNILGTPFVTGNRRPVSGHINAPSSKCTCAYTTKFLYIHMLDIAHSKRKTTSSLIEDLQLPTIFKS